MKRILLTGGRGFIGRNILESWLSEKYQIVAPTHAELDLGDTEAVDSWFKANRVDAIIHGATKPGHRNAKDPTNLFYSNTRMFFNLARHAGDVQNMLTLGSGAIYDQRFYRPRMQEKEWRSHLPADDHGFSKYVCNVQIENSASIVDLRIFGIFGPYEDYSIRFISNMICKALFNLPLTMKQDRVFSYLWIEDLVPILDWFLSAAPKHKAYNIVPSETAKLQEIARSVLEVTGRDLPIRLQAEGLGLEYSGDNSRLITEMPSVRFTSMRDSLERLAAWYAKRKDEIDIVALMVDK